MLREALRRLLWLGPTLLVITIPTFWALARASDGIHPERRDDVPLFFNPAPQGARERALALVARIAENGPDAPDAQRALGRAGGAALPHVLSQLDALGPDARGRVALAFVTVARRMGIGATADLDSPEAAVLFFTRYWEEHSVDFRPAVVRRVVRRFAEHPSPLRESEVLELDTYALEDLVEAMRPLASDADVTRARHAAAIAAHVTDSTLTIPPGASVKSAEHVVEQWEDFWLSHRRDYVAFAGTRRLGATLVETRYGRWLEHVLRRGLGTLEDGQKISTILEERGPTTLALVLAGLLFGYPLAMALGVAASLGRRARRDAVIMSFAGFVAAASVVGLSALIVASRGVGGPLVGALIAVTLSTAALSVRHHRSLSLRTAELVHLRTERAFGASPLRIAIRNLRLAAGVSAALAVADVPVVVTCSFVAERVFALRGLGSLTVEATRTGNQTWLMAFALVGTLTLGVAQIASDLLLRVMDPRVRGAAARAHGAHR